MKKEPALDIVLKKFSNFYDIHHFIPIFFTSLSHTFFFLRWKHEMKDEKKTVRFQ